VNLSAYDALNASYLVLIHADDGVGSIGFAARRRAVSLNLATHLIGVFFEDGVHLSLLSDERDD
jgi:hypothetical protein